jgi:hypothetical protein
MIKLSIMLTEYSSLQENMNIMLEEDSVDQIILGKKGPREKRSSASSVAAEALKESQKGLSNRKSSFYLKNMTPGEIEALINTLIDIFSSYYSRMIIDPSLSATCGKEVFEKILMYSDLALESDGLNYQGIDPKLLDKKVHIGNIRFVQEKYQANVEQIRTQLFKEIVVKVLRDEKKSELKSNDSLRTFYMKVTLYTFSGTSVDNSLKDSSKDIAFIQTPSQSVEGNTSLMAPSNKSLDQTDIILDKVPLTLASPQLSVDSTDKPDKKADTQDQEIEGLNDSSISNLSPIDREDKSKDKSSNQGFTLHLTQSSKTSVDKTPITRMGTNLHPNDDYVRISKTEYVVFSRKSKDGKWLDEELFKVLVKCSQLFFQFESIEEFIIQVSSPSLSVSKDLASLLQINKDTRLALFMLTFDLLRIAVRYFCKRQMVTELQDACKSIEALFLNLLIFDEINRKSQLSERAKQLDAVLLSILMTLKLCEKEESGEVSNTIAQCSDHIMQMLFRAYLSKLEFKVAKTTNLEFLLASVEMEADGCTLNFATDLFEKKFKLLVADVTADKPGIKPLSIEPGALSIETAALSSEGSESDKSQQAEDLTSLIKSRVSSMYSKAGILSHLNFFENVYIDKFLSSMSSLLSYSANTDIYYKQIRQKALEQMVELSFKIDLEQRSAEIHISSHEDRYDKILEYLKSKIEQSGISSESVMRSCRASAYNITKSQRDINGLWANPDLNTWVQINTVFQPEIYDYEKYQRNKYYDFVVDEFLTAQKTRPFLNFDLRRYWHDNYDDVFNDEDKDGAKSVFFSLQAAQDKKKGKRKREDVIASPTQSKKTGFTFFQNKKQQRTSRLREKLAESGAKAQPEDYKLYTENLEDDHILFGKRCQVVDKFKIQRGTLYLINDQIVFYLSTFEVANYFTNNKKELKGFDKLKKVWHISNIRDVKIRRLNQRKNSVEIFFKDGYSVFLCFNSSKPSSKDMTDFFNLLKSSISASNPKLDVSKLLNIQLIKQFENMRILERWLAGDISNFEYIMEVNFYSGRSYNDLSQYPVLPWIVLIEGVLEGVSISGTLGDFIGSDQENFLSALPFRDLTKTVGGMGCKNRLNNYIKRFNNSHHFDKEVPPYHFGSHYSTPAVVIYFLLRLYPFTEGAIDFQSGVFDIADRLFHSVPKCFKNAMEEMSDVRELIPEFFFMPEFLININKLNFGHLHTEERVNSVELPQWCKQNPYIYIYVLRKALECKEVSMSLNNWIDLIFGYKQTGEEAKNAYNVFYYLTYEGAVDMDELPPQDKDAIETQVLHFGQTPSKLFTKAHPKLPDNCPRFSNGLNFDRDAMMLYTRKLKEYSDPAVNKIRGLFINGTYNQKTLLALVKGYNVEIYWWETKTAKEITEKNNMSFRLSPVQEINFADIRSNDAFEFIDKGLFKELDAPLAVLQDKKLILLAGFFTGSVMLLI